jgi:putative DNA primase/helicase
MIKYSRGLNTYDNCPAQLTAASFDEFQEAVLADKSETKGKTYICSAFSSGPHTQKPERYPGINHWRLGCYTHSRCFLAFDFDGFESPEVFAEVMAYLNTFKGFGYTTASHTQEKPRARAIIALTRYVPRDEGVKIAEQIQLELLQKFGMNSINFDESVYRGEQPIYTPVTSSIEYRFTGEVLDVDAVLSRVIHIPNELAAFASPQATFSMPKLIKDGEGRENFILKYSAYLRNKGLAQPEIETLVLAYSNNHMEPPLDEDVVLDRARRYQINQPHTPFEIPPLEIYEDETFIPDEGLVANDPYWPQPEAIKNSLPPVPAFDTRFFPSKLSEYVTDIAQRMSCPPDFPGIGMMVTIQAAIGSRINCKPYDKNPWITPCGAWGMVIAPPSSMKSPPLAETLDPLKKLDREAANDFKQSITKYEIEKGIYEHELKEAIKKKISSTQLIVPTAPGMTRFLVNDATYEKMIEIASHNPNGFLMFRDELVGWLHSLNKENQKEARGLYLTAWSGNDSYATDRIGRGHVRASNVNISVLGTTQPNVIKSVVSNVVHGGMEDDGLIARFQFVAFPDMPSEYVHVDRHPNLAAASHYEDLIESFAKLNPASVQAQMTHDGKYYLSFDEEAQAIFEAWRANLEKRLRDPNSEEHPVTLAHLGKYRSLFPKIALALHLCDGGKGPITKRAALRTLIWINYLEAHARRMYHTATNRALQSAVALSNKIKAGKLKSGFTKSDILTKEWADLKTADDINSALTILSDMDWIRGVEDKSTGGRPKTNYYINPHVKQAA